MEMMKHAAAATLAAAALALALAPQAAHAAPAAGGGGGSTKGSVLVGFEDGPGPAGLALRLDGEFPQKAIGPGVGLSIVGSLGYSHRSTDGRYGWADYGWEESLNVFKLVPAVRFTFGHSPKFRPYADAGAGLFYGSWSVTGWQEYYDPYLTTWQYARSKISDSEIGFMMRFAGGMAFQLSPTLALTAEA
jgi:hypothetical protein